MSSGLTVVTHVNKDFNRDPSRCIESVKSALPKNSQHVIVDVTGQDNMGYMMSRYESMQLDNIVVFVDDDDYITPDSLNQCLAALDHNNVGIAFTYQIRIDKNGVEEISTKPTLGKVCDSPMSMHHMTAFRTKYVTDRSKRLFVENEFGVEWIMKADAISNAGAIFVPMVGYYWVQHDDQHHKLRSQQELYTKNIRAVTKELKKWGIPDINIPEWKI